MNFNAPDYATGKQKKLFGQTAFLRQIASQKKFAFQGSRLYFAGQLKVGINATPISGGLVLSTFASFKMIVVKSESEIKL